MTGGLVITQLIEWLRWHFTDGEKNAVEILREEKPEENPSYWDTVSAQFGIIPLKYTWKSTLLLGKHILFVLCNI